MIKNKKVNKMFNILLKGENQEAEIVEESWKVW